MSEEVPESTAGEEVAQQSPPKKKGLFGKLFGGGKKAPAPSEPQQEQPVDSGDESEAPPPPPPPPRSTAAEVPGAVLTVEYLESGPVVDQTLKEMERRLARIEALVGAITDAHKTSISNVVKNVDSMQKLLESVSRRLDHLWQRRGGDAGAISSAIEPAVTESEERVAIEVPQPPAELLNDPEHVRAQRIARVMCSDLEAYNGQQVKEAALYGNLAELLGKQLEDARQAYEARVPEHVREQFDYFEMAMQEMLIRNQPQGGGA